MKFWARGLYLNVGLCAWWRSPGPASTRHRSGGRSQSYMSCCGGRVRSTGASEDSGCTRVSDRADSRQHLRRRSTWWLQDRGQRIGGTAGRAQVSANDGRLILGDKKAVGSAEVGSTGARGSIPPAQGGQGALCGAGSWELGAGSRGAGEPGSEGAGPEPGHHESTRSRIKECRRTSSTCSTREGDGAWKACGGNGR